MSNYTKSTNFASKDSLSSGNPLKIVKGTEIDTELNNIATAVATKADLNSPALIGTPTAPTASSGTNTTQLATTAFVTAAFQAMYPVGSIYVNAGVSTNPATLLGFGTWTAFGAGRVMVGLNASDSLFNTLEETGGSKDATVVSHTHTATASNASLTGSLIFGANCAPSISTTGIFDESTASGTANQPGFGSGAQNRQFDIDASHAHTITVASAGSSGTNANLQPYIAVAMWKRTA